MKLRCAGCHTHPVYGENHVGHVTIRAATAQERRHAGNFWATGKPMTAKKYVVVDADEPSRLLGGFGLVDGGHARAEAVFWAERFASKNGWGYLPPKGWEGIEGVLPE